MRGAFVAVAALACALPGADAFAAPLSASLRGTGRTLPLQKCARGVLTVSASADSEPMSRRDSLTRIAAGTAGLAVGKTFFDGGSWTSTPDLTGRTIVVTGGNTGLGKETCVRLAKLGADVIIGSRSPQRGADAAEEVRALANTDRVSSMVLDLSSMKSIQSFVKAFQSEHEKLDVLVNNAGVMAIPTREVTDDGFEKQIGINHLGHFHLTSLLMPQLKAAGKATGDARVINLSSQAHQLALQGMNWDDLQSEKSYDPWAAYGQSNLANVLFTRELQKRLARSPEAAGVSTASVHPGNARHASMQHLALLSAHAPRGWLPVRGASYLSGLTRTGDAQEWSAPSWAATSSYRRPCARLRAQSNARGSFHPLCWLHLPLPSL